MILDLLGEKLKGFSERPVVTAGFDGYVDSIVKIVSQSTQEDSAYFSSMSGFADYLSSKAGKSCSLEMKVISEKLGGNMPIYANALSRLGVKVNCIGAMGYPDIHPVFRDMDEGCEIYSVSNPGFCQALEFDDGKVMLAENNEIEKMDDSVLESRLGQEKIIDLLDQADIISFLNWSELKGSLSIWRGMAQKILPACKKRKELFVDLSDCSARTDEDIREMMDLLRQFESYVSLTLSLNVNEAEQLAKSLGISQEEKIEDLAAKIYEVMGGGILIVHLPDGCFCLENDKQVSVPNVFISKPKILTGGGDNFNAGYTYGRLQGLDLKDSLRIANAVSGYYVSHGISPNQQQLAQWLAENKY